MTANYFSITVNAEETIQSNQTCNNTNLFIDDDIISSAEITYTVGDSAHIEKLDMEKINSTASCPEIKLELFNLE